MSEICEQYFSKRLIFRLPQLLAVRATAISVFLLLLQIQQIFHQEIYQGGRIVGPGSFMKLFDAAGICNGVIQLVLYLIKNILLPLLVCRKMVLQFFDNLGTDGITDRSIERPGGLCKMQQ